ncbi:MAG: GNAT family N-acetyltransferase [Lentisphaerota bacterium]
MNTTCYRSIHDVARDEWNVLVSPDHIICSHEFLCAVEDAGINNCRYYYPVVYRDSRMVAHAAVCSIDTELDAFARGILKSAISGVRRVWKDFFILHTLECGSPVGLGTTISVLPGEDETACLTLLVGAMEEISRAEGISVLFIRDFSGEELTRLSPILSPMGYRAARNLPEVRMSIRWGSFHDYLSDMRSEFRSNAVALQRKFTNTGCTVREVSQFSPLAGILTGLWKNAYDHAKEYRREVLTPAFFKRMDVELGERSSVLLAEKDGAIIGFLLLIRDDTVLTTLFSGLDYRWNRATACYFVLFHKALEIAMVEGKREVDFGITTVKPKLDLGGCVKPLYIYVKHVNPLLNRWVGRIFTWMTPQQKTEYRRVFK